MNVSSVVNHYPTANKGFITTLGSTISAGATTVPLTSVSGLTNGTIFVGLIEPGLANEQEFTGVVDTSGVQITGVKWTDGTNVDHTAGVTIVDYVSATGQNMQTKGHLVSHDQDGTLKAGAVDVAAVVADAILTKAKLDATMNTELNTGWVAGVLPSVSSVTANGNRSYDITFGSTVASLLSSGMLLRTTRTVAAPTQCTSLNGTTQYWVKTSPNKLTFTDDFVVSAWVKLASYNGTIQMIASRFNGTSGWYFAVDSSGRITLAGTNAGGANISQVISYQSVPLNKWVHVAAQLDMSTFTATTTTSYVMFDGKDVPASVSRGGTNPTALVQAGNLEIGSDNGGLLPFTGKIAQVAIYNAKVTQATILATISQGLSGSETSLASAYSFNNAVTDLNTSTPNDLTANGSAVATNADSPYGNGATSSTLDYALVMSVSTTTATVQVPEGCTIPTSGGVTSVAYSVQGNPFGWVDNDDRWEVATVVLGTTAGVAGTAGTWTNIASTQLSVPVGSWQLGYSNFAQVTHAGTTFLYIINTLSTSSSTISDPRLTARSSEISASSTQQEAQLSRQRNISTSAATPYYLLSQPSHSSTTMYMGASTSNATVISVVPSGL